MNSKSNTPPETPPETQAPPGGMGVLESLFALGAAPLEAPQASDVKFSAARFMLPLGPNDELSAEEFFEHVEAGLELGGRLATALQGHDVTAAARQTARDRIAVLTVARTLAPKLSRYQDHPPTMAEIVDLARYLSGR